MICKESEVLYDTAEHCKMVANSGNLAGDRCSRFLRALERNALYMQSWDVLVTQFLNEARGSS